MPLTDTAKDRALLAAFAGPLVVSVLTRDGGEPNYPGYTPQPITLGLPKSGREGRWLQNEGEVRFPAVTKDQEQAVAFWVIRTQDGDALATDELEEPRLLIAGEVPILGPETIRVGLL